MVRWSRRSLRVGNLAMTGTLYAVMRECGRGITLNNDKFGGPWAFCMSGPELTSVHHHRRELCIFACKLLILHRVNRYAEDDVRLLFVGVTDLFRLSSLLPSWCAGWRRRLSHVSCHFGKVVPMRVSISCCCCFKPDGLDGCPACLDSVDAWGDDGSDVRFANLDW